MRLNFIANCAAFLTMLRQAGPIRFWAMCGGAVVLTLYSVWTVYILVYHIWPDAHAEASRIIDILGKSNWIALAAIIVIVVSLSNQKLSARGLGGTSIDISGSQNEPDSTVTVETKTEVKS